MRDAENDPETLLPLPTVTFHILVSLSGGDRHGYAIIQDVAASTDGELKIQAGTLYRSIERMLEKRLVAESRSRPPIREDDERRRYYRITPFGRAVATAEAQRLSRMLKLARSSGLVPGKA
jgi:DNA-binding PadR family transcriptional regulator